MGQHSALDWRRLSCDSLLRPRQWFAIVVGVRTIVRKQSVTLLLLTAAGLVSASVGSLIQNAFHVNGSVIFFPLCASLFLLVLKFGPDGWR